MPRADTPVSRRPSATAQEPVDRVDVGEGNQTDGPAGACGPRARNVRFAACLAGLRDCTKPATAVQLPAESRPSTLRRPGHGPPASPSRPHVLRVCRLRRRCGEAGLLCAAGSGRRAHPEERAAADPSAAPRRSGVLLRHRRERWLGRRTCGHHGPGPHVRAHGLQGHDADRHEGLARGAKGAGQRRRGRQRPEAGPAPSSGRGRDRQARGRRQAGRGRSGSVRRVQRVFQDSRALRGDRPQRIDRIRLHHLLLQPAFEQAGAVDVVGVGPLPGSGPARVLQRTRRREGRAQPADRFQPDRPAAGGVPWGRLQRSSLREPWNRLRQRPEQLHAPGRAGVLQGALRPLESDSGRRWRRRS